MMFFSKKMLNIKKIANFSFSGKKFFGNSCKRFNEINTSINNSALTVLFISDFSERFIRFVKIWPAQQWILSLLGLVIMYWLIGSWYNKRLKKQGGWISTQARCVMIIVDIMINIALGMLVMDSPETVLGMLMLRCPIAVSPGIFLLEYLTFIIYYKVFVLPKIRLKIQEGSKNKIKP